MSELAGVEVTIYGYVQGVYFRAFTSRAAKALDLKGYTRNLPGGQVKVHAEGDKAQLERLIQQLGVGPPESVVEKVEVKWLPYTGIFRNFEIRP